MPGIRSHDPANSARLVQVAKRKQRPLGHEEVTVRKRSKAAKPAAEEDDETSNVLDQVDDSGVFISPEQFASKPKPEDLVEKVDPKSNKRFVTNAQDELMQMIDDGASDAEIENQMKIIKKLRARVLLQEAPSTPVKQLHQPRRVNEAPSQVIAALKPAHPLPKPVREPPNPVRERQKPVHSRPTLARTPPRRASLRPRRPRSVRSDTDSEYSQVTLSHAPKRPTRQSTAQAQASRETIELLQIAQPVSMSSSLPASVHTKLDRHPRNINTTHGMASDINSRSMMMLGLDERGMESRIRAPTESSNEGDEIGRMEQGRGQSGGRGALRLDEENLRTVSMAASAALDAAAADVNTTPSAAPKLHPFRKSINTSSPPEKRDTTTTVASSSSAAPPPGYNALAALPPPINRDGTLVLSLAKLPTVRLPVGRSPKVLEMTRSSQNRAAFLGQAVGVASAVPCTRCARSLGPWEGCVVVAGHLLGACCNCHYNGEGVRCSFRGKLGTRFMEKWGDESPLSSPPTFGLIAAGSSAVFGEGAGITSEQDGVQGRKQSVGSIRAKEQVEEWRHDGQKRTERERHQEQKQKQRSYAEEEDTDDD